MPTAVPRQGRSCILSCNIAAPYLQRPGLTNCAALTPCGDAIIPPAAAGDAAPTGDSPPTLIPAARMLCRSTEMRLVALPLRMCAGARGAVGIAGLVEPDGAYRADWNGDALLLLLALLTLLVLMVLLAHCCRLVLSTE